MSDWAEPRDFNEWVKRAIGLRSILMLILVSSIFILELRFDWMERILGTYLATTNSERPESGAKVHPALQQQEAVGAGLDADAAQTCEVVRFLVA